jgi:hypothetical protein
MKSLQTRHKFYNKWLYKITVKIQNGYLFRHNTVDAISKNLRIGKEIRNLATTLGSFNEFQLRIENKYLDIYVNDQIYLDQILNKFKSSIKHYFIPHPKLMQDSIKSKDIVANKLPYDRYRYKVYIKAHAIRDDSQKKNYLKWLETQYPKIRISDSTKDWFINTNWNWDRRYMYVEDEHTLLLAKLRQGDVLGSIYTYQI